MGFNTWLTTGVAGGDFSTWLEPWCLSLEWSFPPLRDLLLLRLLFSENKFEKLRGCTCKKHLGVSWWVKSAFTHIPQNQCSSLFPNTFSQRVCISLWWNFAIMSVHAAFPWAIKFHQSLSYSFKNSHSQGNVWDCKTKPDIRIKAPRNTAIHYHF